MLSCDWKPEKFSSKYEESMKVCAFRVDCYLHIYTFGLSQNLQLRSGIVSRASFCIVVMADLFITIKIKVL